MDFSGAYPVYKTKLKIGIKGLASTETDMVTVADIESIGLSSEGNVESWTPMTSDGWSRNMMTGKSFSVEVTGKRNIGDPGNDYIAGTAWKDGLDCTTKCEIINPDGSKLEFDCVIDVTNPGGGDSTNVTPLEFTLQGDGKPVYTPAA